MNTITKRIVALMLCGGLVSAADAGLIYSEDFESGPVGGEWSTSFGSLAVDTAPGGQNILGANDGSVDGLSNQSVTLSLTGLGGHSSISIGFDLIVIDSMDNSEPFTVVIGGSDVFGPVTFINRIAGPTTSSDLALTGAPISLDTHGFSPVNSLSRSDAVYRINFDVAHALSTLDTIFSFSGLQNIADESWSLDNIQIASNGGNDGGSNGNNVPEPATAALLSLGLAGLGFTRRRMKA